MNKVLLGLLGGMILGIILAPDKGSETLRRIKSRLNDYKDQASETTEEWADNSSELLNEGRSKSNEALG